MAEDESTAKAREKEGAARTNEENSKLRFGATALFLISAPLPNLVRNWRRLLGVLLALRFVPSCYG